MTTISGDLRLVTNSPALVNQAWVRAVETRADGAGVIVDALAPVMVQQGRVEFECAPGVAVLLLAYAGGVPAKTIPLVVAGDSQSLGDAVRAGQGVDGVAKSALDALRVEIAEALSGVTSGVSTVAADVADARASAESAQSSADAAAESADAAATSADAAQTSADSAAVSARSASESAGQAKGDAEAAATSAESAQTSADVAASAAQDASIRAVADKVNELLEGAPEAYDTLKEVAEALEAHEDAASAMISQIAGKADAEHTHPIYEVEGLQARLNDVADGSQIQYLNERIDDHTHAIADVEGLDATLAGKADAEHTHTAADISGLDAMIPKIQVVDALPESPDEATLYLVREA